MQVKVDTEIQHTVADAEIGDKTELFIINCDRNGMTVELSNGNIVTFDLSGGVVSIYHAEDNSHTSEFIYSIDL